MSCLQKQKKIEKQFLTCWNLPHQWGRNLRKEEKENSIRKRALIGREAKSMEENIITNQFLKNEDFLGKLLIALQEKIIANAEHVEK